MAQRESTPRVSARRSTVSENSELQARDFSTSGRAGLRSRLSARRPVASFLPLQAVEPRLQQSDLHLLFPQLPHLTSELHGLSLLRLVQFASGRIAVPRCLIKPPIR